MTATSAIPGYPAPSDPHVYDDHSGTGSVPGGLSWGAQSEAATLGNALGLTSAQTYKIELIVTQERADRYALGSVPSKADDARIKQHAGDQIRALLTPEQRVKFNLVPERLGGGLIGKSPWDQLDRLDKLVHLTPAQKKPILDELIDRTENLMENQAPERAAEAREIRLGMNAEIRALLTPEQQKILDASVEKHRTKLGDPGHS